MLTTSPIKPFSTAATPAPTVVDMPVGKAFADAADYHVPDSGDTALSGSMYAFTIPARDTKLVFVEFEYHRPNDTHVDYWSITTDFMRGIKSGAIPNDTDGWHYRTNGYFDEIVKYFYGGWAFYFNYTFHGDGSLELRLWTSGHNGEYKKIVCHYDPTPLYKLSEAELQSKTCTTAGVIDGETINKAIVMPLETRIKAIEDLIG